jgi:hypothetical protein
MASTPNQERIRRSQGTTPSERYLKRLCDHTFLSLWSYPNVWRDQGDARAGKGKEVCDLLVVFENHIIIFSDRYCEFPSSGNLELDWHRWFKRAVEQAAQQIWGAERWIKQHPDRVFLDQACKVRFPITLPSSDTAVIHRIVVAHGASQRCAELLGGSGSLMIDTTLKGAGHYTPFARGGRPFTVGQVDPAKGYIHVFDDTTLDIVMRARDTIADFTGYLAKKESFLQSQAVHVAGEEELLAIYLHDVDDSGEHNFVFPPGYTAIALGEGFWEAFQNQPQRQAQLVANQISYLWDDLIERFSKHILGGTRHYASHREIRESELPLRFLARERRTRRRVLSEALTDLVANTAPRQKRVRVMGPSDEGDPFYVFMAMPEYEDMIHVASYEDYRKLRREMLNAYCLVTKVEFPHAKDIVGIATEAGLFTPAKSEDLLYLDVRAWTEKDQANAVQLQKDLGGLLTNLKVFHGTESEYPELVSRNKAVHRRKTKTGRNDPCPCGSGRKFKHCCGNPQKRNRIGREPGP